MWTQLAAVVRWGQWSAGQQGVGRFSTGYAPCRVLRFADDVSQRRLSDAIFGSASAIFPHRCLSRD